MSNQKGTPVPAVASHAATCAECGGPLLTTQSNSFSLRSPRAHSAARNTHPRPGSGKLIALAPRRRSQLTIEENLPAWDATAPSMLSRSDHLAVPARADLESDQARYQSSNVLRRARKCRCTPAIGHSSPEEAVTTCTSHPSLAKYLDKPAHRFPPTL